MNASTDHSKDPAEDSIHEATEALTHLADEVERERAERGRSDLDQIHLSDGEELAATLGAGGSEPDPDGHAQGRGAADTEPSVGLAEQGTDGVVPVQNGLKNPH